MTNTTETVLLVEDDYALSDAFGMILELSGYVVLKATNGQKALELLTAEKPNVILLDLLMPVMDGRGFLKKFDNKHHIPVIVLSNLDSKSDVEDLEQLGASGYVLKSSMTPPALVELVSAAIAGKKKK